MTDTFLFGCFFEKAVLRRVLLPVLSCLVLFAAGCAGTAPEGRGNAAALPAPAPGTPLKLAAGDTLKFFYPATPEFNNIQKIRVDGKVSLPLVGEVQAGGKTLPQLQSDLSALYKPHLQTSEVTVTLETSGSPVVISGRVNSPGRYVFERPTTVLEAILTAGGFALSAKSDQVRLIRVVDGVYHTQTINLKKPLAGGSAEAVYVQGGDMIVVPQSIW